MKLFGRSSGYYLFWTGFVYFWVGMYLAFTHAARPEYATLGFVLALSVPLWCPPVARHFNMEPLMFDMFKKKNKLPSNVVPFPKQEETQYGGGDGGGYLPPTPKAPPVTYYTLGMTSENRLEFKIPSGAITMNYGGATNLIEQLETFQKQLAQYEGIEEEQDGNPA
jgi:hypothetical protein